MSTRRATLFISKSTNIFENLAFEEWLLRNRLPDKDGESMLLWSNQSAVVIGRHQNPWTESNLKFLADNNIDLARRYSGGGTVYHDLGNVNISILTTQQKHNRKRNLDLIAHFLNNHFHVNAERNNRDDLVLQPGNRKFSGTAARIVRGVAYHHFTLLVNPDLNKLKMALSSPLNASFQGLDDSIKTNATQSVRASAIGFLGEDAFDVSTQDVMDALQIFYKQQHLDVETVFLSDSINDSQYPHLRDAEHQLRSWDWIYGRTPKFEFQLYDKRITVEGGVITDCSDRQKIGSRLAADLNEAYLGVKLPKVINKDISSYIAKAKCYLNETPEGIDPKLIALQTTVLGALIIALTFPIYELLFGDERSQKSS